MVSVKCDFVLGRLMRGTNCKSKKTSLHDELATSMGLDLVAHSTIDGVDQGVSEEQVVLSAPRARWASRPLCHT